MVTRHGSREAGRGTGSRKNLITLNFHWIPDLVRLGRLVRNDRSTNCDIVSKARTGYQRDKLIGLWGIEEIQEVLAWIIHESVSRDREDGCATGKSQGVGPEAYLNGTSQGATPEDASKDAPIRGRSSRFMNNLG